MRNRQTARAPTGRTVPTAAVHCRKDQVMAPAAAQALAQLILAAHRAVNVDAV
jgi:hypothetical protein